VKEFSWRWEQTQEYESATIWEQEEHWKTRGAVVSACGGGDCCSGVGVIRTGVVNLDAKGSADQNQSLWTTPLHAPDQVMKSTRLLTSSSPVIPT
jgi:hypothetical protein